MTEATETTKLPLPEEAISELFADQLNRTDPARHRALVGTWLRLLSRGIDLSQVPDLTNLLITQTGMWLSDEQTGTGAAQSIAHTLGRTPANYIVVVTEANYAFAVTKGVATDAVIPVTVTTGTKYQILAW